MTPYQKGLLITGFGGLVLTIDIPMIRLGGGNLWSAQFTRSSLSFLAAIVCWAVISLLRGKPTRLVAGRAGIAVVFLYGTSAIAFIAAIYNTTTANLVFILTSITIFSALLGWFVLGERPKPVTLWTIVVMIVAVFAIVIVGGFVQPGNWLAPLALGLAVWLMVGAFAEVWQRSAAGRAGFAVVIRRAMGLQRSIWATAFAHFGMGVTLFGIVCVTAYEAETIAVLKAGEAVEASGYTVRFDGVSNAKGPNFQEQTARLTVFDGDQELVQVVPSKRFYPVRQMPTSEAAIETFWFSQLYIALGEVRSDGAVSLRIWWKPQVTLIWLGSVLMVLGGTLSLSKRRSVIRAKRPAGGSQPIIAPDAV